MKLTYALFALLAIHGTNARFMTNSGNTHLKGSSKSKSKSKSKNGTSKRSKETSMDAPKPKPEPICPDHPGRKFTYDCQKDWHKVDTSPAVNMCGGDKQSPIEILCITECSFDDKNYKLDSGDCTIADLMFSINDYSLVATYGDGCTPPSVMIPDEDNPFDATEIFIHTGCEHRVNGRGCDAELQIVAVERTNKGKPKIVEFEIFLNDADVKNPILENLLLEWEEVSCTSYTCPGHRRRLEEREEGRLLDGHLGLPVNIFSIIPRFANTFKYIGSSTTPPCSGGIIWNIVDTSVPISYAQLERLATLIIEYEGFRDAKNKCVPDTPVADINGYTSRDIQDFNPRNRRMVERVCKDTEFGRMTPIVGN